MQIQEKQDRERARKAKEKEAEHHEEQKFQRNMAAEREQLHRAGEARKVEMVTMRRRSAVGGSLAEEPPGAPYNGANVHMYGQNVHVFNSNNSEWRVWCVSCVLLFTETILLFSETVLLFSETVLFTETCLLFTETV